MGRLLLSALLLCLSGRAVDAHQDQSPLSIALSLGSRTSVRLSYRVVDVAQARQLRERADRDGDGHLSNKERRALAGALAERAKKAFTLEVDGRVVSFTVKKITPSARSSLAVTVDLVATVAWRRGRHRVVVHANVRDARAVTPVNVLGFPLQTATRKKPLVLPVTHPAPLASPKK